MRVLKSNFDTFKLNDKRQEIFISVIPEFGGMLTQINVKGKEILYLNSDLLGKKDIMAGGFPYLFPICGSITDGKYLVKDEEFHMPQHGFSRNMPWKVVSNVTSEKSITMVITHNEETLNYYPFKFEAWLTYELSEGMLIIRQKIVNNSDMPMPFYSGFHPYFNVTDKKALSLDINAPGYINYNTGDTCDYQGAIDFEKPVDHVFFGLKGDRHSFVSPRDGYLLRMYLDKKMKNLVLWTQKEKPFICLEPWMAQPDALNSGKELFFVRKGNKEIIEMGIEVEIL